MSLFGSSSTTKTKPYRDFVEGIGRGADVLDTIASNRGPYGGRYTAPINDYQRQGWRDMFAGADGLDQLGQWQRKVGRGLVAGGLRPGMNYMRDLLKNGSFLQQNPDFVTGWGERMADNPWLRDMQAENMRLANQNFGENIGAQIHGNNQMAAGDTFGNSKYAQVFGGAAADMNENLYGMNTGMSLDQYNMGANMGMNIGMNADQMAMNAANNMVNAGMYGTELVGAGFQNPINAAQTRMGAGDYRQGLYTGELQDQYQRHMAPWNFWKDYTNSMVSGGSAFPTTTTSGGPSTFQGLMNIGTQLGAAYLTGGGSLLAGGALGALGGGGGAAIPGSTPIPGTSNPFSAGGQMNPMYGYTPFSGSGGYSPFGAG